MILRFDRFELDEAAASLRRDGVRVHVQPKVLDGLAFFARHPGRLVTREELAERLWPGEPIREDSLAQLARKIRLALDDASQAPKFLETVPKRGYRFLAEVEQVATADAEVSRRTPPTPPAAITGGGWYLLTRAGGWLVVLPLLGLAIWQAWRQPLPGGGSWRAERLSANPERETEPTISPDGEWLAYAANALGEDQLDLYLAAPGGSPRRLTRTEVDEWRPRFSPDGRRLLFLRANAGADAPDLYELTVAELTVTGEPGPGAERRLAQRVVAATYTPDGRGLAFTRRHGAGDYQLVERSGDTDRVLWSGDRAASAPTFGPGGQLAFLLGDDVWLRETGRENRLLARGLEQARDLAFAPDGRTLYTDGLGPAGGSLSRIALASGLVEPLRIDTLRLFHPSTTADGRLLGVAEQKTRQLFRLDARGRNARLLPAPTTVEGFDVDPEGSLLLITDWHPALGRSTLAAVSLGEGRQNQVRLGKGLCPSLSPDGSSYAFLAKREGRGGLFLADVTSDRRLAEETLPLGMSEENLERCPAYSPDGRRLLWAGRDPLHGAGLRQVATSGGDATLFAAGVYGKPAFAPDGATVAACAGGYERRLVLLPAAGGEPFLTTFQCPFRVPPFYFADGTLGLMTAIKSAPTLLRLDAEAGEILERLPLDIPRDAAFWGVFSIRPLRDGFVVLVERYEADLYLVTPPG